jgi:hypothetical protein
MCKGSVYAYFSSGKNQKQAYAPEYGRIEANHATLAGHTFEHELRVARIHGKLGSVDANQGDPLSFLFAFLPMKESARFPQTSCESPRARTSFCETPLSFSAKKSPLLV